jgi:hypothetical protein
MSIGAFHETFRAETLHAERVEALRRSRSRTPRNPYPSGGNGACPKDRFVNQQPMCRQALVGNLDAPFLHPRKQTAVPVQRAFEIGIQNIIRLQPQRRREQPIGEVDIPGPPALSFSESFGMTWLGFHRVAGLKTRLLHALADELAQVFRHPFSEPLDAAARMLPGT